MVLLECLGKGGMSFHVKVLIIIDAAQPPPSFAPGGLYSNSFFIKLHGFRKPIREARFFCLFHGLMKGKILRRRMGNQRA